MDKVKERGLEAGLGLRSLKLSSEFLGTGELHRSDKQATGRGCLGGGFVCGHTQHHGLKLRGCAHFPAKGTLQRLLVLAVWLPGSFQRSGVSEVIGPETPPLFSQWGLFLKISVNLELRPSLFNLLERVCVWVCVCVWRGMTHSGEGEG